MKTESPRRTFLKQSTVLGGSLLLLGPQAQRARAAEKGVNPATNETIRTIQGLRTIHGNFLDKPIPEAALETILQASVRAANASNGQSYSIVVVTDRKKMKAICTYEGSCMLLYCADCTRLTATAEHLGHSYFPGDMEQFVTATINTTLAVQTAAIAARSLGVDYLITNGIHRGDMERVWKLLDLPVKHCFPILALVLGYPTTEPAHLKGRLSGPGVVHREKYHRLTQAELDGIVRRYDDPNQHLALRDDWKAEGHAHYLDWYYKDWLRSTKPVEKETQMLRLLKRSGFVELEKT